MITTLQHFGSFANTQAGYDEMLTYFRDIMLTLRQSYPVVGPQVDWAAARTTPGFTTVGAVVDLGIGETYAITSTGDTTIYLRFSCMAAIGQTSQNFPLNPLFAYDVSYTANQNTGALTGTVHPLRAYGCAGYQSSKDVTRSSTVISARKNGLIIQARLLNTGSPWGGFHRWYNLLVGFLGSPISGAITDSIYVYVNYEAVSSETSCSPQHVLLGGAFNNYSVYYGYIDAVITPNGVAPSPYKSWITPDFNAIYGDGVTATDMVIPGPYVVGDGKVYTLAYAGSHLVSMPLAAGAADSVGTIGADSYQAVRMQWTGWASSTPGFGNYGGRMNWAIWTPVSTT